MDKIQYLQEEFVWGREGHEMKAYFLNYRESRQSLYFSKCGTATCIARNSKVNSYYRVRDAAHQIELIERFQRGIDSDIAKKVEAKKAREALAKENGGRAHTLKIGDILYSSWGYEQTNIDFYKVTAYNGKTMVTLQPIGSTIVDTHGAMVQSVVPNEAVTCGEPSRHKVNGDWVRLTSFSSASPYQGKPLVSTSYY